MPNFKSIFKVVQPEAESAGTQRGGSIADRIRGDVQSNNIVIYMKGTPQMPQCGFSAATIEVFNDLGVPYTTRNVLEDPELRQGIKEFSNWPTIPQVYVKGQFIGGADIVTEMHHRGDLAKVVKDAVGN